MKSDKPSRNEEEYFAREDAELMRRERERAHAAATRGGTQVALHEVPQGRLRSDQQQCSRRPDRDLSSLRRHVARRRVSWRP